VVFALIDALGWLVFAPFKLCLAVARQVTASHEVRTILVVQLDHLGDAVMSLGLLEALRERFPTARLHVLTSPWNDELFTSCVHIDHVHVMSVTRFSRRGGLAWLAELVRWGWRLRRHRFDLAIDVRGELPHALLLWLSGARRRIGWACGGGGFLLTDRVPYATGRHEVLARAAIAERLGISLAEVPPPCLEPAEPALRWAEEQLAAAWASDDKDRRPGPIIAIHVGAGMPAKRWPAESWRELADCLIRRHGARIVLVGTRQDHELAEVVCGSDNAGRDPRPLNLAGRLSLARLAAVLRRAELFLGADSGPAHVAAATGTPVLALFSGTNDPNQWRPWGREVAVVRHSPACSPCHRETCPWADHPCMRAISPAMVADLAGKMLGLRATEPAAGTGREAPTCLHPQTSTSDRARSRARARIRTVSSTITSTMLRWLVAGWMAAVAAVYLWHMLVQRGS
jgi:heptosyltransferase-2